jgi:hypothetical protein
MTYNHIRENFHFVDTLIKNGYYDKNFEEKKELGRRSYGTVFKAISKSSYRLCAVKN